MKLEEVLPALRELKKIKRKSWTLNGDILHKDFLDSEIRLAEILADDWEIADEEKPKKKITLWRPIFRKENSIWEGEWMINKNKMAPNAFGPHYWAWESKTVEVDQ